MASSSTGNIIIAIAVVVVVAGAALIGYSTQSEELEPSKTETAAAPKADAHSHGHEHPTPEPATFDANALKESVFDIVIGNAEAPLTITEYASLSCPHCADFHTKTLPELIKEFVDTGKAKVVFRHFPLNAPALKAAVAVECAPAENRADFLKKLFETQKDWAFAEGYEQAISVMGAAFGLSAEAYNACLADVDLENRILQTRQVAEQKLMVASTPTIFVGEKAVHGAADIDTLREAISNPASLETPAAEDAAKVSE